MNGRKDDQGKPPLSMTPRSALIAEAQVMAHGAEKYGRDNWRGGMKWSRLIDAAMRHLLAFADGEDNDAETGLPHLAHLRCCAAFLIEYAESGLGEDDRYKGPCCSDIRLVELYKNANRDSVDRIVIRTTCGCIVRLPPGYATAEQELDGRLIWAREVAPGVLDYVDDGFITEDIA